MVTLGTSGKLLIVVNVYVTVTVMTGFPFWVPGVTVTLLAVNGGFRAAPSATAACWTLA
jgi:hypothetical protein